MHIKRNCDESVIGIGAMIIFVASVLLACIILFSMIQITERLVQTPEETLFESTREAADKIIIHEIYVWDEFDNYGIIWELAPGSEPKQAEELYWILQCTDQNDEFWSFWGDFTTPNLQGNAHEFTVKRQTSNGLKAEFFDNQGTDYFEIPDHTNKIPDFVTVESDINFGGSPWTTSAGNLPWQDDFSLRMSGYINIPTDNTYTFELNSDDGSKLWVDGTLVVDNDQTHPMTKVSGNIDLTAGRKHIQVEYFENNGAAGLELRWQNPDFGQQLVPAGVLSHDDNMIDENNFDNVVTVTTFEPGILYEISIDQNNGDSGNNNPGSVLAGETCGPQQLYNHRLDGQFYFIVGGGGTSYASFSVPNPTAGSRLV